MAEVEVEVEPSRLDCTVVLEQRELALVLQGQDLQDLVLQDPLQDQNQMMVVALMLGPKTDSWCDSYI